MPTTVTRKGQVTVPKTVRDYLGLKAGSAVTFERLPTGDIVLRPAKSNKKRRASRTMDSSDSFREGAM